MLHTWVAWTFQASSSAPSRESALPLRFQAQLLAGWWRLELLRSQSLQGRWTRTQSYHGVLQGAADVYIYIYIPHITLHYMTFQYSTVQYSTVQYSTVQYSTVQYSTVQYNTVQYSALHYTTLHDITSRHVTLRCAGCWHLAGLNGSRGLTYTRVRQSDVSSRKEAV